VRRATYLVPFATVSLVAVLSTACGAERSAGSWSSDAPGSEGRRIANTNSCASCHGVDGVGGMGPSWRGLYMSEVTLSDGRTVTADEAYLTRAIAEPAAEQRPGYAVMPANSLTPEQVSSVVEYIISLK